MTLLSKQPVKFSGPAIATAATARAEKLEAELDTEALDEARAALDDEIKKAVEFAQHRGIYEFGSIPSGDRGPVVAHHEDVYDKAEPAFTLTVPRIVWQTFTHEARRLHRKRADIERLRAMAVVYNQQPDEFDLDMDDIHFLGLDRERLATA